MASQSVADPSTIQTRDGPKPEDERPPPGDSPAAESGGRAGGSGGWFVEKEPRPRIAWTGGQEHFPGGWLQLDGAELEGFFSSRKKGPPQPQPGSSSHWLTEPLVWDAARGRYEEPTAGQGPGGFEVSEHSLDRSSETLRLAGEVAAWRDRARLRGQGRLGGRSAAADEDGLYVQIAAALADKLADREEDRKQDYASEILALRRGGELVGVADCYRRTKTRALILKYALANPDSQLPREHRPHGAVGGVGRAVLSHLAGRAQHEGLRSARMEALSLRLYLSAASLGFRQIGTTVPPLPQDAFLARPPTEE